MTYLLKFKMMSVVLFKFIVMFWLTSHLSKAMASSSSPVNNCYTFHDIDSTWDEARDACREKGAHLVTLETTAEWNKLKSFIAEKVANDGSYTHWYIGLRKEGETWKWTEAGSPGVVVASDDSRWQDDEPTTGHPIETCGEINSNYRNQLGHFNNVECNVRYNADVTTSDGSKAPPRGYICENY
ncbi:snaclec salmorin subunit A-like [Oculina patagonica]